MRGWYPGLLTIFDTTDEIISYLMNNNFDKSVRNATYRFRFLMYLMVMWTLYKDKPCDSKEIKAKLRRRNLNAFREYLINSRKKTGDFKLWIKFVISII